MIKVIVHTTMAKITMTKCKFCEGNNHSADSDLVNVCLVHVRIRKEKDKYCAVDVSSN